MRRSWRVAVGIASVVLLAPLGCSDTEGSGDSTPPDSTNGAELSEPVVAEATFEDTPCPDDVVATAPASVRCGHATLPEVHSEPDGPSVRLTVAIVEPEGGATEPDPVFYLDGGPGGDGVTFAEGLSELPLATNRSVVIVGQRGSLYATPSLECSEIDEMYLASLDDDLGEGQFEAAQEEALDECYSRVSGDEVEFDAYDSATAADDLEAVRRALGHEEWNLYGISYGTRLALEVLRRHPDAVRSAVLDSSYPAEVHGFDSLVPNARRGFEALESACGRDAGCAAAYPDLLDRVAALYETLESGPVDSTVPDPETGEPTTVRWDGDRTMGAAFLAMYETDLIPLIPFLLDSFEDGQFDLATTTLLEFVDAQTSLADGLFMAVECRERAPFEDAEEISRQLEEEPEWLVSAASPSSELGYSDCGIWKVSPADRSVVEPVVTDRPVLLLAGEIDPITPPAWGRQIADAQATSYFFEFPGHGHGVSTEPCAAEITAAFLDDPDTEPDSTCVDELAPIEWVLPG